MKNIILIIIVFAFLTGCYWGKTLEENQKIRILTDFTPIIDNSISSVYINNNTTSEYKQACIEELKSSFSSYHVTVVENENMPVNFTLMVEKLRLKESTKSETVNDESSPYNGQSYELIVCNVDLEFKIYQGEMNQNKLIGKYNINAEKEEKVTNNRNLGDYMFGSNKDNSEYRHKLLSDDIFLTLSKKTGSRTCARATTKISKRIK